MTDQQYSNLMEEIRELRREVLRLQRHVGCEETSPEVASLAAMILAQTETAAPMKSVAGSALTQVPNRLLPSRPSMPLPGPKPRPPYRPPLSNWFSEPAPVPMPGIIKNWPK